MVDKFVSWMVFFMLVLGLVPVFVFSVGAVDVDVRTSMSDAYIYTRNAVYLTARNALSGTANSWAVADGIGQHSCAAIPTTYYVYRSYVYFDTSGIPGDAVIDDVWLNLTGSTDYSGTDFDIVVQNGQPAYPHDPAVAGDYYMLRYSGDGGSVNSANYPNLNIELNSDGKSWINRDGTTKLCLRSSRDILSMPPSGGGSSEYLYIYSREGSATLCPWLNISYTVPGVATEVSVSLNSPSNGTGYANWGLPVPLNLTVNETLGRNMTINLYGDDNLLDSHYTSGNETHEYPWSPVGGGIHVWNATVNCSEGFDEGVWGIAKNTSYCDYSTGSYSYMGIINVAMNDGELCHGSGYSNTPYENFTFTGCNLTGGKTYELDVTLGGSYTQALAVWVDWNNNSVLDADERTIGDNTGSGTGTHLYAQVTVPGDAVTDGSVLMRVITDYQTAPENNPCGIDNYGDCEDYSIKVVGNCIVDSETRWFAVDYFNDTFTDSTYIDGSVNVEFVDDGVNFTLVSDNTFYVTLGVNDGYCRSGSSSVYYTGTAFYTGGGTTTYDDWILVSNVVIPQSTVIDDAYLSTYSRMTGTPDMDIFGNDVDNPSRPLNRADYLSKVRTTVHTDFDGVGGTAYAWQNWDVTSVVQELVDTRGYTSEGMQFLLYNDTTGASHYYYHYGYEYGTPDGGYAPELHVCFTDADKRGNITSVNISKPDNCLWGSLLVSTNRSDNLFCNFSVLDGDGNVLLDYLDGLGNSLGGIDASENMVRLFGNFSGDVQLQSWNVSWFCPIVFSDEEPSNNSKHFMQKPGFWTNLFVNYSGLGVEQRFEYYTTGDTTHATIGLKGQSFTVGTVGDNKNFVISKVRTKLFREAAGDGNNVVFSIRNVDGSGLPTGGDLSVGTINVNTLPFSDDGSAAEWMNASMSSYTLLANTKYALIVTYIGSATVGWRTDIMSPTYTGGCYLSHLFSWYEVPSTETMFEVWGVSGPHVNISFEWFNSTLDDWEYYGNASIYCNRSVGMFNSNFSGIDSYWWRVCGVANDTRVWLNRSFVFDTFYLSVESRRSELPVFLALSLVGSLCLFPFIKRKKKMFGGEKQYES